MALKTTIQFRRDHLSAWQEINPKLAAGEIALVDLNNGNGAKNWVVRIGDGVNHFNDLPETAYALSADVAAQISAVISAHEADVAALQKTIEDGLSGNSEALAEAKEELNGAIDSAKTELSQALSTADANLSAGVNAVKGELTALIDGVEAKVDNKIQVGDATSVAAIDTLTIKRVSIEDYHNILTSETIDDGTLYVVSSDNLNAFGSRVVQVGDAVEETDAVNLKQLNAVKTELEDKMNSISSVAGGDFTKLLNDISDVRLSTETISSTVNGILTATVPALGEEIGAVDDKIDGVAEVVGTISSVTIPGLEGEIGAVSSVVSTLTATTIPGLEEEIAGLEISLSAYEIAVSTSTDDTNRLKSWTFTQGGTEIAKVEVPFDIFVDTGAVVEHDGETCLELTLKDGSVVHIPVNKLVDVYTGGQTDTISVTVGEDFVISAEVRDGAITTDKLADKAVTAGKIADKTITYAQIADGTITGTQISAETIDQSKLTGEFIFDCGGAAG